MDDVFYLLKQRTRYYVRKGKAEIKETKKRIDPRQCNWL